MWFHFITLYCLINEIVVLSDLVFCCPADCLSRIIAILSSTELKFKFFCRTVIFDVVLVWPVRITETRTSSNDMNSTNGSFIGSV
jgi:hypothetical protein